MSQYVDPYFEKRLRRVVKRNNRLATAGVVHKMQADGLVVARPRIYTPRFPWQGLILLLVAVFVFKGYVYYALGAADFTARAAALSEGSVFEQLGGLAMLADPVTIAVSDIFARLLG